MELMFTEIQQLTSRHFSEEASIFSEKDNLLLDKTASTLIAGLFGAFLVKGDNSTTEKILSKFKPSENEEKELIRNSLNEDILQLSKDTGDTLFLNKRADFISLIAEVASISFDQAELLVANLTSSLSLYFVEKLENKEYTISGLLAQIYAERDLYCEYLSSELLALLDISSILKIGHNLSSDARVASHMLYIEIKDMNENMEEEENQEEKTSWFKWFSSKAAL